MPRYIPRPCGFNNCNQDAQYALNQILPNGKKVWIYVCKKHEEELATKNLQRAGGYIGRHYAKNKFYRGILKVEPSNLPVPGAGS